MELRVLAFVLAGGKGTRLYPLTKERAKPAVPFGGRYRIVDFVLSNLVNSGVYSIYVLVQFKSQSLLQHLREGWDVSGLLNLGARGGEQRPHDQPLRGFESWTDSCQTLRPRPAQKLGQNRLSLIVQRVCRRHCIERGLG